MMTARDSQSGVDVSLAPDPVIEAYKKDIDRTLIRENLKLTPDERLRKLDAGDLDILGEITYGGTYEALLPDSEIVAAFGIECRCLSLERLIQVKRAVGRVKDLEAIAELEAIAGERRR
jgi:hypothetical protein